VPPERLNQQIDKIERDADDMERLKATARTFQRSWPAENITKPPELVRKEAIAHVRQRKDVDQVLDLPGVISGQMRNIVKLDALANMRGNVPALQLYDFVELLDRRPRPFPTRLLDAFCDGTGRKIARLTIGTLDEPPRRAKSLILNAFGENEVRKFRKFVREKDRERAIRGTIRDWASATDAPSRAVNTSSLEAEEGDVDYGVVPGARRARRLLQPPRFGRKAKSLKPRKAKKKICLKPPGEASGNVLSSSGGVRMTRREQVQELFRRLGIERRKTRATRRNPRTRRSVPKRRS